MPDLTDINPRHVCCKTLLDLAPLDLESDETALQTMFFKDFCIEARDRTVSRGYFDGLELLIAHTGPSSDLANAARAVVQAAVGNKVNRIDLVTAARQQYGRLLLSFQQTLSSADKAHTIETLMTAALLGLYEVGSCNRNGRG